MENTHNTLVVVAIAKPVFQQSKRRVKQVIKWLAICEILLGALSFVCGITTLVISTYISYRVPTLGEGAWCGVMIILAGGFGTGIWNAKCSRCFLICHFVFSIFAIGSAAVMFSFSVMHCVFAESTVQLVFASISCIVGISSFGILIASCVCCCIAFNCCCCCDDNSPPNNRVTQVQDQILVTNNLQPITIQDSRGCNSSSESQPVYQFVPQPAKTRQANIATTARQIEKATHLQK